MGIPAAVAEPHDLTPPSIEELTVALRKVLRKGLPVTPDRAPNILLGLRGVRARAIDPTDYLSKVRALNVLLTTLLVALGQAEEAQALHILFALRGADRGTTLTSRRRRACRVGTWAYDETHFRKSIEPRLVRGLAWLVHEDSQSYTPRTRHAPEPMEISGDTPALNSADINEQEELVSRIWALVYELRAELILQARLEAEGAKGREFDRVLDAVLWVVARLLTRIQTYLERYGERILQGDAEFRAEGLIRLAGWRGELLPEIESQRLRLWLAEAGEENREGFLELARSRVSRKFLETVPPEP